MATLPPLSTDTDAPLLEIRRLHKRFGATHAVRGVDLSVRPGEFVGLMGPNGAGKSTLIKILAGVHSADSGEIRLAGRPVASAADVPEVGFVHQDLGLIDSLSVLDNLRLGAPPLRLAGPLLHRGRERRAAQQALERVELRVSVNAVVGSLSPGEKALLAVARLLDRGARFIVVDETTSTLPPRESRWFIETLHRAARDGTAVLMVSHKLSELLGAAERVVVMLDGQKVYDQGVGPEGRGDVVRLLAEHEEQAVSADHVQQQLEPGETLLELQQVSAGSLGPIDLTVRAREVVGLTGLVGSGLHDVGLLACGALRPTSGHVKLKRGARRALVAPQRETQGVIPDLPVLWNASVASLPRWRNALRLLHVGRERAQASESLRGLRVVPADVNTPVKSLSGGNQQKVLFSRALLQQPDVYILCEPTRGVDIRTRHEIYRLIAQVKEAGAGVLIITSDSEDLFAVCDRVGTVERGRVSQFWDAAALTEEQLSHVV